MKKRQPMIYNIKGDCVECINPNTNLECRFLIDLEDLPKIKGRFWCNDKDGYIISSNGTKLHRYLMNVPKGFESDHIFGNKCDNRKAHLRICTRSDNNRNQSLRKDNTSGYKGIIWDKKRNKWLAWIQINKKRKYLGYFTNKHEAAKIYNESALKYFGEFAWLNKIQEE